MLCVSAKKTPFSHTIAVGYKQNTLFIEHNLTDSDRQYRKRHAVSQFNVGRYIVKKTIRLHAYCLVLHSVFKTKGQTLQHIKTDTN